ncbi:type II toxin-antitoxin system RelE/ParE family toxin [Promineifilum sp.]|uniref:type II toxin-antitoxin system RelE/ParE family toxin n=1 Tax=Promineifilum sp. TaxID=2664178 RepID=UPI0035B434D4
MRFIETSYFTKQVIALLPDEEYRRLQEVLLTRPEAGDLIPGGGGLRKLRWRIAGKGKRGGLRLIYYWAVQDDVFFMLTIYKKSQKEDLTLQQLKALRVLVEEWLK